ncbi:thiamine pyrophosphate-requiring protein [Bradyrhizobium sp. SYSU BS000235]|uniref:thiamine pyrophosphate-requiring protein n=1 Tax=Bradyrhizobium sp. SYSU BS000235 TaxID=3411332 RepID=UPI003C77DA75
MTTLPSTAEIFLRSLGRLGVEYIFGNAGTDAAPIIEAYARCGMDGGESLPLPVLATHENLALTMAHGYAMVSGKLPAAFVHVSVGTANAVCPIMNAARENVPILLSAGRTPIYEDDRVGSRDSYIHWGQEMFDQASLLREFVKWDYELRGPAQVETVVQRAVSIAMSEPRGPVYLSLPREVLAEPMPETYDAAKASLLTPALPSRPSAEGVRAAAEILSTAQKPLIIAGNSGRDPSAVSELVMFTERFQIPVVQHRPRYMQFPTGHSLHLGFEPAGLVEQADAILVLDCDVPWIPKLSPLRPDCRVIHAGPDPLFGAIPIRGFQCDLALTSNIAALLVDLTSEMEGRTADLSARRAWVQGEHRKRIENRAAKLASARGMHPIHPAWVSHCIEQIKGDAVVINEYTLMLDHCGFSKPGSYFGSSSASGLGWGMGAALGAKLAKPDSLVIATLGDGAYLFANPVAGHYAAHQHKLPVLFVIFNNGMWDAVRQATLKVYPDGVASTANSHVLTELDGLPAFEQVCIAAGGYGERVEHAADLPAALERALNAVRNEKRQALLNIICQPR